MKLWSPIRLTWMPLKTYSKDSAAEWNYSRYRIRSIELAVPEVKIEEEITQSLEYTDDSMGQKKNAKLLCHAKAHLKNELEENKSASSLETPLSGFRFGTVTRGGFQRKTSM